MAEVEERLSLDISDALAAVGTLEEALTGSTGGFQAALDAAVESFRSQLDSIAGEQVTVPVDADIAELRSDLDAVEGETVTVTVDADTSQLVDELGSVDAAASSTGSSLAGLGEAASEAAGGGGSLTGVLEGMGIGLASANGGVSGLVGGLGKFGPQAAAAAAAVAGLIAVTSPFVADAQDARTALDRFNRVLGDTAAEIENIHLDGVADDLSELAIAAGADDDTLRLVAARLFEVGRSAGLSEDALIGYTRQLLLLATRASVGNPTLGSTSDIIDGLSKGLARGGRFLDQYGISLTAAQINARALADTGKATADQLTVVEKSAAGAAIAFERLGERRIGRDIAANLDQPAVKMRSLATAAKEAGEASAGSLVDSFAEIREAVQPLVLGLGVTLVAALRVVVDVFRLFTPLIELAGQAIAVFGLAANAVIDKVEGLAGGVGKLGGIIAGFVPGPLKGLASGLFGLHDAAKDKAEPSLKDLEEATKDAAREMDELKRAAEEADRVIGDQLAATLDEFAAGEAQRDSAFAVAKAIREQAAASKEFTDAVGKYGAKSGEAAAARLDLVDAEEQVRDATVRNAEALADLRIKQLALTDSSDNNAVKARIQAEEYRALARSTTDSGLAGILEGLATRLDGVARLRPSTVVDIQIQAAIDNLDKLDRRIVPADSLERRIHAAVDVDIKPALTKLDALDRRIGSADAQERHIEGREHGGPFHANQLLLVGEEGRELVRFPQAGAVINNTDTERMLAGSGSTINVYEVGGDPYATAFAVGTELGKAATR